MTFPFMTAGCSSTTTNNSHSDNSSADNSSAETKQTIDTIAIPQQNDSITKIYTQAIGDYIRLVKKEYNMTFDTLFFGKHVYDQADDFPEIALPAVIEQTNIKLISPDQGTKKQKENQSSFYINLIGWVNDNKAEFTYVTFSNGMAHQFDGFIIYKKSKNGFVIESSRFENFLFKKK
jgi:hypothetical protein